MSYRQIEQMTCERGVGIDHTTRLTMVRLLAITGIFAVLIYSCAILSLPYAMWVWRSVRDLVTLGAEAILRRSTNTGFAGFPTWPVPA